MEATGDGSEITNASTDNNQSSAGDNNQKETIDDNPLDAQNQKDTTIEPGPLSVSPLPRQEERSDVPAENLTEFIWQNYPKQLKTPFRKMLSNKTLVDVTLICQRKKIYAHKCLLAACSPYFQQIFRENPSKHPVVVFKDVQYADLLSTIAFIYQGEVKVQLDRCDAFWELVRMFSIPVEREPKDETSKICQLKKSGTSAGGKHLKNEGDATTQVATAVAETSTGAIGRKNHPMTTSDGNVSDDESSSEDGLEAKEDNDDDDDDEDDDYISMEDPLAGSMDSDSNDEEDNGSIDPDDDCFAELRAEIEEKALELNSKSNQSKYPIN